MRWLLLGGGLAWLAAAFSPEVRRCQGSGSDETGDYTYECLKFKTGRWQVEINWWDDRVPQ